MWILQPFKMFPTKPGTSRHLDISVLHQGIEILPIEDLDIGSSKSRDSVSPAFLFCQHVSQEKRPGSFTFH